RASSSVRRVDRAVRHKSVDLDGVGALDLDRFELPALNDEGLALGHPAAPAFVLPGDWLAGLFIDELWRRRLARVFVDLGWTFGRPPPADLSKDLLGRWRRGPHSQTRGGIGHGRTRTRVYPSGGM